jgi:DNA polymerase I-like protein with 3'-5' exonuclease and polymerase domains
MRTSSGDPYLSFAKQADAVPPDATKQSHKAERDQFKACVLAVQYGMGPDSLAQRIRQPPIRARELLRLHRETYRAFWRWSDQMLDFAMLKGHLFTVYGWCVRVPESSNERSLRNFPMQANGAEMLRLACCLATERGIEVCAPVHDAVLIAAPLDRLDADIGVMQDAMREASRLVLNGFELGTDVAVYRHPDRYMDERGKTMWQRVMALVNGVDHCEVSPEVLSACQQCAVVPTTPIYL